MPTTAPATAMTPARNSIPTGPIITCREIRGHHTQPVPIAVSDPFVTPHAWHDSPAQSFPDFRTTSRSAVIEDSARSSAMTTTFCTCLMPNPVHLIAVPLTSDGLQRAIGEAHRRYTLEINVPRGWRGHLWQGRFSSFVMDDRYTLAAARYVELNPVRAQLVSRAEEYPWSSAQAHLLGRDDGLVCATPLLARV